MKKLLFLSLLALASLVSERASAQSPFAVHHGRSGLHKNDSGIVIETQDSVVQAVARIAQSLEAAGYQVVRRPEKNPAMLAAMRTTPGNNQVTLIFSSERERGVTYLYAQGQALAPGQQKAIPITNRGAADSEEAKNWAALQQVATSYPNGTVWYRNDYRGTNYHYFDHAFGK